MDFIVGFLFLITVVLLILFFMFQPDHNDKRSISIYNTTMVGLNIFITGLFFLWMRATYKGSIDDGWWLFMGLCGSFIIFSFIMLVAFVVRNFWLFKVSSQNFYRRR